MQKIQTLQPVQQVQTPPKQQIEPSPIQQFQPSVESTFTPEPTSAPIKSASIEPAFASVEPTHAFQSTEPSLLQQLFRQPAVSIPFAPTFENSTYAILISAPQAAFQQPPPFQDFTDIPTSEMPSLVPTSAPRNAPHQPPPPTPQRITYTAASNPTFIPAAILNTKTFQAAASFLKSTSPQTAVSGCIFYKKGMG